VAGTLVVTSVLGWEREIDAPENAVYAGASSGDKTWIDDALSTRMRVTKLYTDEECGSAVERHALYLTEFFNAAVDRAAFIGDSLPDGLPIDRVDVGKRGVLLLATGKPLVADYVYTQAALELEGQRVATGTAAGLVLWDVAGPVRVVGATSNAELRRNACA
jgi:hypothetical protein